MESFVVAPNPGWHLDESCRSNMLQLAPGVASQLRRTTGFVHHSKNALKPQVQQRAGVCLCAHSHLGFCAII